MFYSNLLFLLSKNPQLEARLNIIRARAEDQEYSKMVNNVDTNVSQWKFKKNNNKSCFVLRAGCKEEDLSART